MDTVGEGESDTNGESINIYTLPIYILSGVRWLVGEKLLCSIGSPVLCSVMTWRDGMGKGREAREGADFCCCMAETNTTLYKIIYICVCMHARLLQLCPTLCNPVDCSLLGSSSMGFSRKEY